MTAIAKELRLSVSRISRLIAVADMAGYTRGQEARPDPEAGTRPDPEAGRCAPGATRESCGTVASVGAMKPKPEVTPKPLSIRPAAATAFRRHTVRRESGELRVIERMRSRQKDVAPPMSLRYPS